MIQIKLGTQQIHIICVCTQQVWFLNGLEMPA
jgi:hypothetical protein